MAPFIVGCTSKILTARIWVGYTRRAHIYSHPVNDNIDFGIHLGVCVVACYTITMLDKAGPLWPDQISAKVRGSLTAL